jgi:hypothetical protein
VASPDTRSCAYLPGDWSPVGDRLSRKGRDGRHSSGSVKTAGCRASPFGYSGAAWCHGLTRLNEMTVSPTCQLSSLSPYCWWCTRHMPRSVEARRGVPNCGPSYLGRSRGQVTIRPEVDRVISSIGVNEVASGSRLAGGCRSNHPLNLHPSHGRLSGSTSRHPRLRATITAAAGMIPGDPRVHSSLVTRIQLAN